MATTQVFLRGGLVGTGLGEPTFDPNKIEVVEVPATGTVTVSEAGAVMCGYDRSERDSAEGVQVFFKKQVTYPPWRVIEVVTADE